MPDLAPLLPGYTWLKSRTGRIVAAIDLKRMILHWKHGKEEEFFDLQAMQLAATSNPAREEKTS